MKRPQQHSRRSNSITHYNKRSSESPSLKAVDKPQVEPNFSTRHRLSARRPVRQLVPSTVHRLRRRRRRTSTKCEKPSDESPHRSLDGPDCVMHREDSGKPSDGTHRCKICGCHFGRASLLKTHLLEHGSDRPFVCFVCNLRFTTKWNLMKHQKCRSHRVVQAKSVDNIGCVDKLQSAKHIPLKKRKIDDLPSQLGCQLGSLQSDLGDHTTDRDSPLTQSHVHLKVLPFASPIATQLQAMQLSEACSELKLFTNIVGTLTIELTANRTISLPVSLKCEDVMKCLANLGTHASTNVSIRTTRPSNPGPGRPRLYETKRSTENTLSSKGNTHDDGLLMHSRCVWSHRDHSPDVPSLSVPATAWSPDHVSLPRAIDSRTQEELQAARTILSLAHSGGIPYPNTPHSLQATSHSEVSLPCTDSNDVNSNSVTGELRDPLHQTQINSRNDWPTSPKLPVKCMYPPKSAENSDVFSHTTGNNNRTAPASPADWLVTTTTSVNVTSLPISSAPGPEVSTLMASTPMLLQPSRSSVEVISSKCSSHSTNVPKQLKPPPIPIRPPPKKRLSIKYRDTSTVSCAVNADQCLASDPTSREKSVSLAAVSTACSTTVSPIAVITTVSTTPYSSPHFSHIELTNLSTMPQVVTSGSVLGVQTISNSLPTTAFLSTELMSSVPSVAPFGMPGSTPTSSNSCNSLPTAPNLFILPQLMVLPRIISPYIPMAPNHGMVTSCFLVQPDTATRATPVIPTPTDAATTSAFTPPRNSTPIHTCTQPISVSQTRVAVTSAVSPTSVNSKPLTIGLGTESQRVQSDQLGTSSCRAVTNDLPITRPTFCSGMENATSVTSESVSELIPNPTVQPITSHSTAHTPSSTVVTNSTRLNSSSRLVSILPALKHARNGNRTTIHNVVDGRSSNTGSTLVNTARSIASRNRYRCYECGLVCHKPCLLRKHYRTHSNVRPYVCRHCDVSFKTRGNLSKHMKSRGHHDRCVRELGLDQAPLVVDDTSQIDRQALERQRQLVLKRDHTKRELWRSRFRAIRANCSTMPPRGSRSTATDDRAQSFTSVFATKSYRVKRKEKPSKSSGQNSVRAQANGSARLMSLQPRAPLNPSSAVEQHSRIPAPNVNAVHLLQDLPLNLSVRPRELAILMPYTTDPVTTSQPSSTSNLPYTSDTSPLLRPIHTQKPEVPDPEEMVRTAVAAARILNNGAVTGPNSTEASSGQESCSTTSMKTSLAIADTTMCTMQPHYPGYLPVSSVETGFTNRHQPLGYPAQPTVSPIYASPNETRLVSPPSEISNKLSEIVSKPSNRSTKPTSSRNATSNNLLLLPRGSTLGRHPSATDIHASEGSTHNGKPRDPRPYKCSTCRVGFRVTGHLHKHYRAKSHLLNELQAQKWSADAIEFVRLSRINVSQVVNPDNGQLRARALERLVALRPANGSTSVASPPLSMMKQSKERSDVH